MRPKGWRRRARQSFRFADYVGLVMPTGLRASNLREFLEILRGVDTEVLNQHLNRVYLNPRFEAWDYPNDFARWAGEALEDHALAEKLSALDPYAHENLEDARGLLVEIIEEHAEELPTVPWVRPGFEFHFSSGHYIAQPSGLEAWTMAELRDAIEKVHIASIYFHFHEARLRGADHDVDDFTLWIEGQFGEHPVAAGLRHVDFYFYSLEELRRGIVRVFDEFSGGRAS